MAGCSKRSAHGFNPRAREGRDKIPGVLHIGRDVSIHAPARGATVYRIIG